MQCGAAKLLAKKLRLLRKFDVSKCYTSLSIRHNINDKTTSIDNASVDMC